MRDIARLLSRLKKARVQVAAVEQSPRSINYSHFTPKYPLALIFGSETRGVPAQILDKCDVILEIKMRGKKESLNVAVAVGIILYGML